MSEVNRFSPVGWFRRLVRSVRIYGFVIRGVVRFRCREWKIQDRIELRADFVRGP